MNTAIEGLDGELQNIMEDILMDTEAEGKIFYAKLAESIIVAQELHNKDDKGENNRAIATRLVKDLTDTETRIKTDLTTIH